MSSACAIATAKSDESTAFSSDSRGLRLRIIAREKDAVWTDGA
jgi:hypothetical protein